MGSPDRRSRSRPTIQHPAIGIAIEYEKIDPDRAIESWMCKAVTPDQRRNGRDETGSSHLNPPLAPTIRERINGSIEEGVVGNRGRKQTTYGNLDGLMPFWCTIFKPHLILPAPQRQAKAQPLPAGTPSSALPDKPQASVRRHRSGVRSERASAKMPGCGKGGDREEGWYSLTFCSKDVQGTHFSFVSMMALGCACPSPAPSGLGCTAAPISPFVRTGAFSCRAAESHPARSCPACLCLVDPSNPRGGGYEL